MTSRAILSISVSGTRTAPRSRSEWPWEHPAHQIRPARCRIIVGGIVKRLYRDRERGQRIAAGPVQLLMDDFAKTEPEPTA